MNTIGAVREPVQPFSPEEVDAMQSNDSTEHVLNKVAHHSGYAEQEIEIHGADKTFKELRAEFKEKEGVHYALEQLKEHSMDDAKVGFAHTAATRVISTRAGLLTEGLGLGAIAAKLMWDGLERREEKNKEGQELHRSLVRDEMHNALTMKLELPQGFKQTEIEKRDYSTRSFQSLGMKMASELGVHDKAARAVLQLHCDEGMHAARDMFASGQDKAILFTMQPSIRARYDADAAFRLGFDALVWAKNDPNTYAETVGALQQRDARYNASHIAVKG